MKLSTTISSICVLLVSLQNVLATSIEDPSGGLQVSARDFMDVDDMEIDARDLGFEYDDTLASRDVLDSLSTRELLDELYIRRGGRIGVRKELRAFNLLNTCIRVQFLDIFERSKGRKVYTQTLTSQSQLENIVVPSGHLIILHWNASGSTTFLFAAAAAAAALQSPPNPQGVLPSHAFTNIGNCASAVRPYPTNLSNVSRLAASKKLKKAQYLRYVENLWAILDWRMRRDSSDSTRVPVVQAKRSFRATPSILSALGRSVLFHRRGYLAQQIGAVDGLVNANLPGTMVCHQSCSHIWGVGIGPPALTVSTIVQVMSKHSWLGNEKGIRQGRHNMREKQRGG
ncbi:hypothetical protein FA15DRAFT_654685 [Coprinopsis marcescibilis]|nr:hypothetical protein FA15DRAFT_654685 [Coprinopsis marcescibilis]